MEAVADFVDHNAHAMPNPPVTDQLSRLGSSLVPKMGYTSDEPFSEIIKTAKIDCSETEVAMKRTWALGGGMLLLGLGLAPFWRQSPPPPIYFASPNADITRPALSLSPAQSTEYIPSLLVICGDEWLPQTESFGQVRPVVHQFEETSFTTDFGESQLAEIPSRPNLLLIGGQEVRALPQTRAALPLSLPVTNAPTLEAVEGPMLSGSMPALTIAPVRSGDITPPPMASNGQGGASATPNSAKPMPSADGSNNAKTTTQNIQSQANSAPQATLMMPGQIVVESGPAGMCMPAPTPMQPGPMGCPQAAAYCGCGPHYGGYYSPPPPCHRCADGQAIYAPSSSCNSCASKPSWFKSWFRSSSSCDRASLTQSCKNFDACEMCDHKVPRVSIFKRIINWFSRCSECDGYWD